MLIDFSPSFCPQLPIIPSENFLDVEEVLFGEGPNPFPFIEESPDLHRNQLALLCLATREVISRYLQGQYEALSELPGISCLTSAALTGLCGFVSACLSYQLRRMAEQLADIQLIYHQAADLFPEFMLRHMFIIANIEERHFIVDLSVRQFFNAALSLHRNEVDVCDAILKYGFVELNEHSLSVYRRLLLGNTLMPSDQLVPIPIESLQKATAVNDFEDEELEEFLFFRRNQRDRMIRAHSQQILARPVQSHREMKRTVSDTTTS